MRKSRLLAFIGLLALTTLGSILLLNLRPGNLSSVKATAHSTGLAYLPEDSDFVAHVYVNRALNSPLISRFLSEPDALNRIEMFVREVGLDPRHDISEVLLGGKTEGSGPVIFVRGGLLRDKLQAFISRKEDLQVETQTYKGLDILTPNGFHGGPPSLVFFDDNLLGFGERATLESAIDVQQGAASSILNNSKMMSLLSTINQTDTFWLASTNDHISLPPVKELQALPLGKAKIRNVALSGNLDIAISGKIFGFFDDAETAKNFASMGRGLLTLGKMQSQQQQPDLVQVLDGLTIDDYQNQVILSVQIPYSVVEKMMNQGRQMIHVR